MRIGLMAVEGTIDIHGMRNSVAMKSIAIVKEARQVFPPAAITAALSAEETVGDVPRNPLVKEEKAVA